MQLEDGMELEDGIQLEDGMQPEGRMQPEDGGECEDGMELEAVCEYEDSSEDPSEDPKDPLRFSRWMKRSAAGAVMTGIAIGLREALEPRRPEVAIVVDADEPDVPDGPIELHFDPDSPQNTVAVIRVPPSEPNSSR